MHFALFLCKLFGWLVGFCLFSPPHVIHRSEKAKYQLGVHLSPGSCLLPPSQRSCIVPVPFVPEKDPWIVTHSSLALVITWPSSLFDLTCYQLYQNQNCCPLFCRKSWRFKNKIKKDLSMCAVASCIFSLLQSLWSYTNLNFERNITAQLNITTSRLDGGDGFSTLVLLSFLFVKSNVL